MITKPARKSRSLKSHGIEPLEARIAPATIYAVDFSKNLLTFDSATPGTIATTVAVTGLQAGESIEGLDVRPATGQLFALGITDDGATRTGRIYTINPTTAAATLVGATPFSVALSDTSDWGFDFNPAVDRIRIVNDLGQNLRVNPNDGTLAGTDTALSVLGIDAVAYDRNAGGGVTTLYAYNFANNNLATIGGIDGSPSPNGGVVTNVGPSGLTAQGSQQLDIESGTNIARLATSVGGLQSLYTVNLTSGATTLVGTIGAGAADLRGMTSASSTLAVVGTGVDDTLVVTATGPTTGSYVLNGGTAVPFAGITGFSFSGGIGNDTLTINNPVGSLFAPSGGIDYNGGGQTADALNLLGGGGAGINETYFVGTTTPPIGAGPGNNGSGLIRFTGSSTVDIRFTGLAPIVDTVAAASLTVNATDAANTIAITNATTSPRVQVSIDAFEPIEFNNKTALTVNGGDGVVGGDLVDTVSVNFTNAPAGLTGITVNADEGSDVVNVTATSATVPLAINTGADFDVVNIGNNGAVGSPGLLTPIAGAVTVDGGAGGANLTVDGSGAGVNADYTITGTTVTRSVPTGFGGVTYSNASNLLLTTGNGANVISVNSTSIPTNVTTNGGDDSIVFANGVTLNGGTVDGGLGIDTLDYSAYTTAVSANLGSNAPGGALAGTLEGAQENPGQVSTATGTVSVTYNAVAKTYDISAAVSNLLPGAVTGYHIHRGPVGVNGPIIVDLAALFGLGALVPSGSGFTFSALGVVLPAGQEAAFLGGVTYFNVHTAAAPGGLIRGQILPNGVFTATTGTATGTASIAGVENVTGGTAADSLVGDLGVNILRGGGGNDTIVGAPGNDTLDGGDNSDTLVWSNGDNNDVIDGGLGADTVQVNGSVTAGDVFTVGANVARVAFARTNLVPFTLDIGTTETLIVNGAGGDDAATVNTLVGVADLTAVNLFGLAGNDTFTLGAGVITLPGTVNGGTGTDTLVATNGTNVWAITAADGGTLNTTTGFVGMETLSGGSLVDTFNVNTAATLNLKGGGGVDVFALGVNTLTGTIDGEAAGGSITGAGSPTLTAVGGTIGFNGTAAQVTGGFSNITDLQGTGTLKGLDAVSAWSAITGGATPAGTYTSTNALTFSGYGTLQGGSAIDTFTLTGAATASLKGGGAVDVFALATNTLTGSIDGEAAGGSITGIASPTLTAVGATIGFNGTAAQVSGGFSNITDLQGTGTLKGLDAVSAWSAITGGATPAGTYTSTNALTFSGFGTLQGGSAVDTFTLTGAVSAILRGGGGVDVFALGVNPLTGTIDGEAAGGSITGIASPTLTAVGATTGFNGTAAQVTGGFSNITDLQGTGTLTGANLASGWAITGVGGTYTSTNALTFSGYGTLQGGSAIDTFTLGGAATAILKGGGGVDVFALGVNTLTGTIDGEAAGGSITGIASPTLTAVGATTGFNGTATQVSGGFSNITDLQGSGTLTGANLASGWAITGVGGTYTSTNALTFSGFNTLQGGSAIDTFTLGGAATATLKGGAGVDVFALGVNTLTGTIDGEAAGGSITGIASPTLTAVGATTGFNGTATQVSGGFSNITDLQGSGTLTGGNLASGWAITGVGGTYTSTNALTFSGYGTLQGGSAIDTFTLTGAATAILKGGGGVDVFALGVNTLTGTIDGEAAGGSITGIASPTLTAVGATTGFNGTATQVSGGFSNITDLQGSGTLTGANLASGWAITGVGGTYTSTNALTFSGYGTLQGGSAIDTFTLSGATTANLKGGGGVDVFALATNTLTGTIDGEAAGGSITGIASPTLTALGATTGFNGTAAQVTGGFSNITDLQGTGTLTGANFASGWAITGVGGTYTSTNALTFSGYGTLQGGSAIDTFTLGGATTANLKGGGGVDVFALGVNTLTGTIDGEAAGGSITGIASPTLTALGSTTGFNGTAAQVSGGFSNITDLQGAGTLIGLDAVNAWSAITGGATPAGIYTSTNALTFSGYGTLQGGSAVDTFALTGAVTALLKGGGGVDVFALGVNTLTGTIDGEAAGGSITGIASPTLTALGATTGFNGTAVQVTGGFSNITDLQGSGTLTGANFASGWAITGVGGTYTSTNALTFTGYATLQGGSAIDTFTLGGAATATLKGGNGVDVFALGVNTLTGAIDGEAAGGSITGIASPTLTALGGTTGFNGTASQVTLGFNNTTDLVGTGTLTGLGAVSTWTGISGGATPAGTYTSTNPLTFSGFATLQGGSASDTFTLAGAVTADLKGGAGADTFIINAALTGTVDGEAASDTLDLQAQPSQAVTLTGTGTLDGFAGTTALISGGFTNLDALIGSTAGTTDSLTGTDAASTWTINGPNAGSYSASGRTFAFSKTENLIGGTNSDAFIFTDTGTLGGTIKGGGGSNSLTADDQGDLFTITGAGTGKLEFQTAGPTPTTITKVASYIAINNLLGGAGGDTFEITNWSGGGTIDGKGGADTIIAVKDTNFLLTDLRYTTAKLTSATQPTIVKGSKTIGKLEPYAVKFTKDDVEIGLTSIDKAVLTGGTSKNLIDAGQFSGEVVLSGDANVDVLIAGKGNSTLYGFSAGNPNGDGSKTDYDQFYVRDNPGGSVVSTIHATKFLSKPGFEGNTIHFRESSQAVNYTLPTVPKLATSTSVAKGTVKGLPVANGGAWPLASMDAITGVDLVANSSAPSTFKVNLSNGIIQHLEGSRYDDKLKGNNVLNTIYGGAGNDTLTSVVRDGLIGGTGTTTYVGATKPFQLNGDPLTTKFPRARVFFAQSLNADVTFTAALVKPVQTKSSFYYSLATLYYPALNADPVVPGPGEAIAELRGLSVV